VSIIRCDNLTKQFGTKTALKNVSFELEAGEPIALVGPNGAGKTTLFSILCGYLSPTSGSVALFDTSTAGTNVIGRLSALPQDAQFDPGFSIKKQLTYYAQLQGFSRREAEKEALRVLELMVLTDVGDQFPGALSHGMRKRAAIAQALIGSPELVFLDEPTAGLDPENARNIRHQISVLSDQTTFIISSHNLQELERLCQTVLHLDHGELQQQTSMTASSEKNHLTIHVDNLPKVQFQTAILALPGVESITSKAKNEYVIQYAFSEQPNFDLKLLQCLASNNWQYRQLTKGKTLEDQLFSK
jgi:ABC-2 type transport system ATP-binding protein